MSTQKLVGDVALTALASDIKNEVIKKANSDGNYENLTAGNAEQLLSDIFNSDSVPYNFRQTGGSVEAGTREFEEIVGGTIAFDQLNKNNNTSGTQHGVTFTNNGDGSITAAGTPDARAYFYSESSSNREKYNCANHVFISLVSLKSGTIPTGVQFGGGFYNGSTWLGQWTSTKLTNVFKVPSNAERTLHTLIDITQAAVDALAGGSVNFTVTTNFIDLTQMFGSTIADYIYSLEQGNEGAGVAWFRALFPNPYYAYNSGELMSVKTSKHINTGKNLLKNEATSGTSGTITFIVNEDKSIIVNGSTTSQVLFRVQTNFSCDDNLILTGVPSGSGLALNVVGLGSDTGSGFSFNGATPRNIQIVVPANTVANNIRVFPMVRRSGASANYEPYSEHEYPLASNLELRGIPKLDRNNKLYYDGDTYSGNGSVIRNCGYTALSNLTWTYNATTSFLTSSSISDSVRQFSGMPKAICDIDLEPVDASSLGNVNSGWTLYNRQIVIKNTALTEAQLRALLTNKSIVYQLSAPTTETADAFKNPQICDGYGTEQYVDDRAVAIPVGHNTKYLLDLKGKVEQLYGIPSAPTTNGTYKLRCVVSGGIPTYSWVSDS